MTEAEHQNNSMSDDSSKNDQSSKLEKKQLQPKKASSVPNVNGDEPRKLTTIIQSSGENSLDLDEEEKEKEKP